MGTCLSSQTYENPKPSANVVSAQGELRQYPVPVSVSEVLQLENSFEEVSSFVICSSDGLYFDEFIESLDREAELVAGQIYFVLPASKLQYRLSASDMAALAVKASMAMENINGGSSSSSSSSQRRKKKARISPVLVNLEAEAGDRAAEQIQMTIGSSKKINYRSDSGKSSAGLGVMSRSGSVRKLQKYSSRRAKLAVRSFRMKLNTIYEGSVLHLS